MVKYVTFWSGSICVLSETKVFISPGNVVFGGQILLIVVAVSRFLWEVLNPEKGTIPNAMWYNL